MQTVGLLSKREEYHMPTNSDEYNSLREELLEHQKRRIPFLSLALTASVTLFAVTASKDFRNPYLPLFALLLLHSARVQLTETEYGIERIASYIKIMHEDESKDLHWETGSYAIRHASLQKHKEISSVFYVSPLESTLLLTSAVALFLSVFLAWSRSGLYSLDFVFTFCAIPFWVALWFWYSFKVKKLRTLDFYNKESEFWRKFRSSLHTKKHS
jgi:hypothetical protein